MRILVIDGQGGNLGRQLVKRISEEIPNADITAVGTNSIATGNMLKSGSCRAATGENAVIVGTRTADIIVGPVGIVVADSLLGEVTPAMAVAVGQSAAHRVLVPMNRCETLIAGVSGSTAAAVIDDAVRMIKELCEQ